MTKRFLEWLQNKWFVHPNDGIENAYAAAFSTPEGRVVLQHLLDNVYCRVCEDGETTSIISHNARRGVIHEILENIDKGENRSKYESAYTVQAILGDKL